MIVEALDCLNGPREDRAKKVLDDILPGVESRRGPLPSHNGDLSRLLYQRYKTTLRQADYLLRLQEMVMGPDYWSPSEDEERRLE